MILYRLESGEPLDLTEAETIGIGGQARILAVSDSLVAKIYHRPTPSHGRKLAAMLASPPVDPSRNLHHVSIAWPVDRLVDEHRADVVGFLMPRLTGMRRIFEFYNPRARRQHCPFFDYTYLHRAARNLAATVGAVHSRGYVIGDLNESNILLRDTALVSLVDCDSFQVRDQRTGEVFRCPVGKAEYTPPELQGVSFATLDRGPEHDCFALAVIIFQLLMEGAHPFTGEYRGDGDAPPITQRISSGHYPFDPAMAGPYAPPRASLAASAMAPGMRELFVRAFRDGWKDPSSRPTAQAWQTALRDAELALVTCGANEQHRYGGHLEACPWCERAQALGGRDPFPARGAVVPGGVSVVAQHPLPPPTPASSTSVPSRRPTPTARRSPRQRLAAWRASLIPGTGGGRSRRASSGAVSTQQSHDVSALRRAGVLSALCFAIVLSLTHVWQLSVVSAGLLAALVWVNRRGARYSAMLTIPLVFLVLQVLRAVAGSIERDDPPPVYENVAAGLIPEAAASPRRASYGEGVLPLRQVSAGDGFTCGVGRDDGGLYCVGTNIYRTLVGGSEESEPVRMVDDVQFAQVAAGRTHACAVSIDGALYCWGEDHGGSVTRHPLPAHESEMGSSRPIAPTRYPALTVGAVVVGEAHTCVLTAGTARCFGENREGQLGAGDFASVAGWPRDVVGDHRFFMLAAGDFHTCGLTASGIAYCWGSNELGQLGVGRWDAGCDGEAAIERRCHTPVPVANDLRFLSIVAGGDHSCGLTRDGAIYCWGSARYGQTASVGTALCATDDGRVPCEPTPRQIPLEGVRDLAAGASHSCALLQAGEVWCWGLASGFQSSTVTARDTCPAVDWGNCAISPTPVSLRGFQAISAGSRHTCGELHDQVTVCWGAGGFGRGRNRVF